jgi:hypothetical protein
MWTRNALKSSKFNWQWKCWDSVTGLHTIPKKSVWQHSSETGVCKTSVHHILQSEKMYGAKRNMEYAAWPPDSTPLGFHLWGDFKNTVWTRKPRTLQGMGQKVKLPLLLFNQQHWGKYTTLLHIIINSAQELVVDTLNVCEFKVTNETKG